MTRLNLPIVQLSIGSIISTILCIYAKEFRGDKLSYADLSTSAKEATPRFHIVEESPNGTEIVGVSEYLQTQLKQKHEYNTDSTDTHISFQLLDSYDMFTRVLQVDAQSGRLSVDGRIDREALCPQTSASNVESFSNLQADNPLDTTSCVKRLSILATVGSDHKSTVELVTVGIEIVIDDINDNIPSWSSVGTIAQADQTGKDNYTLLTATILEQTLDSEYGLNQGRKEIKSINIPAAYDPDYGLNGEISYYLENFKYESQHASEQIVNLPHNPETSVPFKITGPVNGQLELTPLQLIDYEKQSVYDLLIIAADKGRPQNTGYAHLKVYVVDVNDESPVFTQSLFMPTGGGISERTPPGSFILNVTATDADGSEANNHIRFYMVPSSNFLISKYFSVHQDGRIQLRQWLDYEALEPAHMSSSSAAARAAPRSSTKQFSFFIQAVDSAPPPYEKTGTALVVIPIIDENVKPPLISSRFLGSPDLVRHGEAGVITENSSVPIRLAYIQARDPDFNGRDKVECVVMDNPNLSLQSLAPSPQMLHQNEGTDEAKDQVPITNDFLLSLESPVDREVTQVLVARIHCEDEAKNPSDKLIRIRVLDINDEVPTFLWPVFYFSVKENRNVVLPLQNSEHGNDTGSGYRIGRVIAHDRDQGDNAKILYNILPKMEIQNPVGRPNYLPLPDHPNDMSSRKATDLFRIDAFTGEIYALRSFDAEQIEKITFQVIAVDQPTTAASPSHTGTASVYVRIVDANDWSPIFFRVNGNKSKNYSLLQDSEISVVDSYVFSVLENQPPYTNIGRIGAVDPDVSFWPRFNKSSNESKLLYPQGSRIDLQFAPDTLAHVKESLSIHSTTGQISTLRPLDREMYANYIFHVVATDKDPDDGFSRTSTAVVSVIVEDENDNDPVFIIPHTPHNNESQKQDEIAGATETKDNKSKGNIETGDGQSQKLAYKRATDKDNMQVIAVHRIASSSRGKSTDIDSRDDQNGRPLIRVEARDPDGGLNGEIRYSIGSEDVDNLFYLDPVSGSLILKSSPLPDRLPDLTSGSSNERRPNSELSYQLQIEACDRGTPKRCAKPVWLRILMDNPVPNGGGADLQNAWKNVVESGDDFPSRETKLYSGGNIYTSSDRKALQQGSIGSWSPKTDQWHSASALSRNAGYNKEWSTWNRGQLVDKDGRLIRDFSSDDAHYESRKGAVTASEAVIICLAVIFALLLCAALVLVYLVKRKSIYFSVAGRKKSRESNVPSNLEYADSNFKSDITGNCGGLDACDKSSLYRMIADPRAPGKIVFVDNNFDGKNLPHGARQDSVALNSIVDGKSMPFHDYRLRRGLSASAAVLTNLESVYISPEAESPIGTSDYPELISRSTMAFNYQRNDSSELDPTVNSKDHDHMPNLIFGTMVGQNGMVYPVRYGASAGYVRPTRRVIENPIPVDMSQFQRRCSSLKPRHLLNNSTPYQYMHPQGPYIYGSVINSPPGIVHCRGTSEPITTQLPYSPKKTFLCTDEDNTYNDIGMLNSTIHRQHMLGRPLEQVDEVTPTNGKVGSPYGRLDYSTQRMTENYRFSTLTKRSVRETDMSSFKAIHNRPCTQVLELRPTYHNQILANAEATASSEEQSPFTNIESYDLQDRTSQASLNDTCGDSDEFDSITDQNAKLIAQTNESFQNERTLTLRKYRNGDRTSNSTKELLNNLQNTDEVLSEGTKVASKMDAPISVHPTYMVHNYHEASFV